MSIPVTVVAQDASVRERLASLIPPDSFAITTCSPDDLPGDMPGLFVVALPALDAPEERLIEKLRADEATATIPIVIASTLPMVDLQSVDYIASDWTIAIVEEPVQAQVLTDTIGFLVNPDQA